MSSRRNAFLAAVVALSALSVERIFAQSISVPLGRERWTIGEKNERIGPNKNLESNGKVVAHLGRPSLCLVKGFAFVRDLDLQNGTIDADMSFDKDGYFIGLAFRVRSEDDYELFFFRNGAAGTNQAIQYTPGFLGERLADLQRAALCGRWRFSIGGIVPRAHCRRRNDCQALLKQCRRTVLGRFRPEAGLFDPGALAFGASKAAAIFPILPTLQIRRRTLQR